MELERLRVVALGGFLLLILGIASCRDEGPRSGPGAVTVSLLSPNGSEGAFLGTLRGPGIGQITSVDGVLYEHRTADTVEVLLVLQEPGTIRLTVELTDTLQLPQLVVREVADGQNRLRSDLGSYGVEVRQ